MRPGRNLGGSIPALTRVLAVVLLTSCTTKPNPSVEPFHRAVLRGDLPSAAKLLAADPSLARARDEDGLTALHLAAVRLRLSPDARLRQPGAPGEEPAGDRACAPMASFTSYDRRDLQRLMARSRAGNSLMGTFELVPTTTLEQRPMAELLIARGAQVDARTKVNGYTPLHFAVRMGHRGVAEALLEHGADVNAGDHVGLTALGMAAQSGNVALARVLIERGASVDRQMRADTLAAMVLPIFVGDTPLALAVLCSQQGMVAFLLDRGANPNLRVRDGFAPLHLAETSRIAELLIARGADLAGRGYESRTPLHQAAMRARSPIVALLLDRGVDPNALDANGDTPLLLSLSQPNASPDVIGVLIEHGADVNLRSRSGKTALHAALGRDRRITVMLLDAGAAVDAPDQYGRTALHWAVENKDYQLVELLLERGAPVNAKDKTGRTPLYYTWGGSEVDRRIADLLKRDEGTQEHRGEGPGTR